MPVKGPVLGAATEVLGAAVAGRSSCSVSLMPANTPPATTSNTPATTAAMTPRGRPDCGSACGVGGAAGGKTGAGDAYAGQTGVAPPREGWVSWVDTAYGVSWEGKSTAPRGRPTSVVNC